MTINKKIQILLIGANIWYFGEGMFGPLFAIFAEEIGGDILSMTWAWATYLIVAGFMYILVGKYVDKHKNKEKIMILGYALNAVFTFSYLFITSPWHLFIIQAGLGLSAALATPTWNALYSKNEDKKDSVFEWGLAGGSAQIITGIAIIIGGLIVNYFSFTTLFITMGIIQIVATIIQSRIISKKLLFNSVNKF